MSEEYIGRLAYEMIEKISTDPLSYCNEIKMSGVIENDPEGTIQKN